MDHTNTPLNNNNTDSKTLPPLPIMLTIPTRPLYLIRLSQSHESFRLPELISISTYFDIPLKIHTYSPTGPFCIVSFPTPTPDTDTTHAFAKQLISRSILAKAIYHLYADGTTYDSLHTSIRALPSSTWTDFENVSFKFSLDAFRGKRSMSEQRDIVEGFRYLPFRGKIRMSGAQEEFVVFEEWPGLTPEEHARLRGGGMAQVQAPTPTQGVSDEDGTGTPDILAAGRSESATTSLPKSTSTSTPTSSSISTSTSRPPLPTTNPRKPTHIYFARHLSLSQRHLIEKHDLKKRPYISTTSMDAELALITASMAHAGPGRLVLDPFVGTGGFMVAAAELGAITAGSDIDGRSFRGKGKGMQKGVLANFRRYGIEPGFGDCVTGDLTNSPFRIGRGKKRWLDAIICDPPYGVREGLKVLGRRVQGAGAEVSLEASSLENGEVKSSQPSTTLPPAAPVMIDGVPSHTLPGFIAPKRPYSFDRMLGDILDFAARTLVDGGRLAFWMPCANEAEEEFAVPRDPKGLVILRYVCVQNFNRWSRRLLVYERVAGEIAESADGLATGIEGLSVNGNGHHADDLNQFRRMYFQGFNRSVSSSQNENG